MTANPRARDYRFGVRMAVKAKVKLHYDMQFELIVIGDSGVGKTCILLRYADDMFKMTFMSTIGKQQFARTIIPWLSD